MANESKIELLLAFKNNIKSGMAEAKKKLGNGVNWMKNKLGELKDSHVKAFSAMKDQIPGLESAMSMLTNPYVLVTALIVAMGVALFKCVDAAAEFNTAFVPLKNLNLDKSNEQIKQLKGSILDSAWETGIAAKDMLGAYSDIQGGLGLYGKEVDKIAIKVGNFSIATQSELTENINSTVKAMQAFGFGSERLDEYLASNAKAVNVGIVSFSELAKVQTEFSGAAAAAGQDFNTANKLFATFSLSAKNADIAANMTKSAFQGFTMKPTIDGLRGIGINLTDASGKMKSMDVIIKQLVPKINKMSDAKFLKFRNEIGGPEGLQNLFNQLRTSGDKVLETFQAFDDSQFSITDALKNAKGDLNTMKQILGNQINNIMIRIGDSVIPDILDGLGSVLDYIMSTFKEVKNLFEGSELLKDIFKGIGFVLKTAMALPLMTIGAIFTGLIGLVKMFNSVLNPVYTFLKKVVLGIWEVFTTVGDYLAGIIMPIWDSITERIKSFVTTIKEVLNSIFQPIKDGIASAIDFVVNSIKTLIGKLSQVPVIGKIFAAFKTGFNSLSTATKDKGLAPEASESKGSGSPVPDSSADGGVSKVVGETKQARNMTINIQALHKGDNKVVSEKAGAMTVQELERMMTELFLRMVRNVEGAY